MFFPPFFIITNTIMKILIRSDMDSYHTGFYHSYDHTIDQPEYSITKKRILYNIFQINNEKKALLDILNNPKKSIVIKINEIQDSPFHPIDSSFRTITSLKIKNGGLIKDWDFSF